MRSLMMLTIIFVMPRIWSAPVPKELALPEITPGTHETLWELWGYSRKCEIVFYRDGTSHDRTHSYVGYWDWDKKKRRLTLWESKDDWQTSHYYCFEFDKDLVGKCIESATTGEVDAEPRPVTWRFAK